MAPVEPELVAATPYRSATVAMPTGASGWPRSTLAWAIGTLIVDAVLSGGGYLT